jgi:uncharacterized SAM-binding protein YcdF (DUF218 family)
MLFQNKRWSKGLSFLTVVILVWPPIAWLAANALIIPSNSDQADAIVVLGGASTYIERTELAAQLFKEGKASKILLTNDGRLSGWVSGQQRNPYFVERSAEGLKRLGVPDSNIEIIPEAISNTHEEARLLLEQAKSRNLRSILVVTSAYHSRRARWVLQRIFQESNIKVNLACVQPGQQTPTTLTWWIYPRGWQMVAGEYIKTAYYWLFLL